MTPSRIPHRTTALWCALAALLAAITLRAQAPPQASGRVRPSAHAPEGLFSHSDNCVACHNNLSTPAGEDVSIGAAWRSTIMANAARDPYFYASVRRETVDHPARSRDIQDECAACHVPIAQKVAHMANRLATILDDPGRPPPDTHDRVARDGVSCTVCHQIASEGLGTASSFNGNFRLRDARADGVRDVIGPFTVDKGRHTIMDAYVDLQSVADHTGHFFVVDMQADGLRKALKLDEAFDSTSVENGAPVSFDGRWEAQKLTEEQYNARFAQDDERYARMLAILRAALARKTT